MNAAEQAKAARAKLLTIDPGFVAGIDALKADFGAKLTGIQVGDIVLGGIARAAAEWEAAPVLARYIRPGEANKEWEEIKKGVEARISAGRRAGGRKR